MTQGRRPASATRESVVEGGPKLGWPKLAFATFGAAIAWAVHFLLSYFLVALGCTTGWRGTDAAIGIATVVLAAVAAWSGWIAFRNWRPRRGRGGGTGILDDAGGRRNFMLVIGILSAGLFGLLIVLEGLSPVFLSTCVD